MCKSGRRKRDIDETRSSDSGGSKNIPLARQGLRQWKDEDKTLARTPGAKVISDPCGAGYIRQQEHLRVHADWRNWQFPSLSLQFSKNLHGAVALEISKKRLRGRISE